MKVEINYSNVKHVRSIAYVDGKKTTITKAQDLVAGKWPVNVKETKKFDIIIYDI